VVQKEQRNSFLFTMELAVFSSISLLVSLVWSADGQVWKGAFLFQL
jgi:hypothetical protein